MREHISKRPKKDKTVQPDPREGLEDLFPEHKNVERPKFKEQRDRYDYAVSIPEELPTAGLLPYPIDVNTFIGEFESKKNLYLTFAHHINKLTDKIKELETRISDLENA